MVIRHKLVGSKGMFFIQQDDEIEAEMVYTMPSTDKMLIEHTVVNEELRGQNIGYQLVDKAVEYARTHNLKVILLCPFAKSVFDKKPDFRDVLA